MNKIYFLLIILLLSLNIVTADCIDGKATSIEQYGITWNFDQEYDCGTFVNGDYWVVGPLTIISITPNFDGSHNGWMINMDSRVNAFDSRAGGDMDLVPSLPYIAQAGDAIIKAISMQPYNESFRPTLKTTAVLTILDKVPPNNGVDLFRPSFFGTIREFHSVNEINPSVLPSIDSDMITNIPSLNWMINRFKMMQLDIDSCCSSEPIRAVDNFCEGTFGHACSYGGRVALDLGDGALRLMLNDSYEDKYEALIYYLQTGLDLYYQMKQGISWYPNGGHGSGRKLPIIFAGILLENDEIKNAVKDVEKGVADSSVFQEDGFLYAGKNNVVLFGSGGNYWSNVVTDYDSRTSKDPYGYIDGGPIPGTSYQSGINSMIWKGPLMAMKLMPEIEEIWDNPLFIDYVDRWVTHGTWSLPDPCAPVMGYCIGGENSGDVCTYANKSVCGDGICAGGVCPSGEHVGESCVGIGNDICGDVRCSYVDSEFWQVTYGPNPTNSQNCILDTDLSDGIGRFPFEHGLRADTGGYQSAFVNSIWNSFRYNSCFNGQKDNEEDGIDCGGICLVDLDNDGFFTNYCDDLNILNDCNDDNNLINPNANEICDDFDNNCDGIRHENFYLDTDNDGINNCEDNCWNIANVNQFDYDFDGIGDLCDDTFSLFEDFENIGQDIRNFSQPSSSNGLSFEVMNGSVHIRSDTHWGYKSYCLGIASVNVGYESRLIVSKEGRNEWINYTINLTAGHKYTHSGLVINYVDESNFYYLSLTNSILGKFNDGSYSTISGAGSNYDLSWNGENKNFSVEVIHDENLYVNITDGTNMMEFIDYSSIIDKGSIGFFVWDGDGTGNYFIADNILILFKKSNFNSENNINNTNSIHDADVNNDNVIDLTELNSYVNSWRSSNTVTLANLIEAIRIWKQ